MPLNWYMGNYNGTPTVQTARPLASGTFYRITPHPTRGGYALSLQYDYSGAYGSLIGKSGRERLHAGRSYDGFDTVNEAMAAAEKSAKLREEL